GSRAPAPVDRMARAQVRLVIGSEAGGQGSLPAFIPGLALAHTFYIEAVRPLVNVPHAAGLFGEGSEVLGFDQPRSTDHAWGPRLHLLVADEHVPVVAAAVEQGLPSEFRGWPVRFFSWQTNSTRHHVEILTLEEFVQSQLGAEPPGPELPIATWLALPQQRLLQVTGGELFHDGIGRLRRLRAMLAWYPRDVWLWAMASQWHLIGNAEPRIGRAIEAGDRRGCVLIAARLVRLLMELAFLQERRYWPYEKWFGTAFSRLQIAAALGPQLDAVLSAQDGPVREHALHRALALLAEQHNRLGLTPHVAATVSQFRVGINNAIRPYLVFNAGEFAAACRSAIGHGALRELVTVGTFDQLTHADDALVNFTRWPEQLADSYARLLGSRAGGQQNA
uniref:DUF4037 domain-containing protein n=1 Tax=Geminicoccus flavidas TaxID=2506407 RepID=UPI001F2B7427